jgi:hypothetical protein
VCEINSKIFLVDILFFLGGGGVVLNLDKYVSLADVFYVGGRLRLESSGIRVNMVCFLQHDTKV